VKSLACGGRKFDFLRTMNCSRCQGKQPWLYDNYGKAAPLKSLEERGGVPLRFTVKEGKLVPCHGYYYRVKHLYSRGKPPAPGQCCQICFQKERVDKDGNATMVRAHDMFEGGYWSEEESED
jgi:hypothetical protein